VKLRPTRICLGPLSNVECRTATTNALFKSS